MLAPTVTVTSIPCPRACEHKETCAPTSNVWLRLRPDGSYFCPVHGDVKASA